MIPALLQDRAGGAKAFMFGKYDWKGLCMVRLPPSIQATYMCLDDIRIAEAYRCELIPHILPLGCYCGACWDLLPIDFVDDDTYLPHVSMVTEHCGRA